MQAAYEIGGFLGVDPSPFTLRQLCWMRDGRQKEQWTHTANVLTLTANLNRSPNTKAFKFDDFYPFAEKEAESLPMEVLKDLWVSATKNEA